MEKRLHISYKDYLNSINEEVLNEKVFDINDDVDFLIKESGIEKFYNEIKEGKTPYFDEIMNNHEVAFLAIKSNELKSEAAIKADEINPILIFIGFPEGTIGSHYNPKDKYILVSPIRQVFKILYQNEQYQLKLDQIESFKNDLKLDRLKHALAHELSHWISDSLHNSHIEKIIDRANELNKAEYMKLKNQDVNMTYFEIDAIIHGIKELKRQYTQEEWDQFTFRDVMIKYTAITGIDTTLKTRYGLEVALIWQKNLFKRMQREGLLGLNMRSFYKEMPL
jgi:hypothetical protein